LLALTKNSRQCVHCRHRALTKLVDVSTLPELVDLAVSPDSRCRAASRPSSATRRRCQCHRRCDAGRAGCEGPRDRGHGGQQPADFQRLAGRHQGGAGRSGPAVRVASIQALRELGKLPELPVLVDILVKNRSEAETVQRRGRWPRLRPANGSGRLRGEAGGGPRRGPAGAEMRPARPAASRREDSALQAVRAAVTTPAPKCGIRRRGCSATGIRRPRRRHAGAGPAEHQRNLPTAGFARLPEGERDKQVSAGDRLAMCKEAAALVKRDDEKTILLGVWAAPAMRSRCCWPPLPGQRGAA